MAARNNHSDVVEYLLEQVNEKIQCSLCRERPKTMMFYNSQAEHVTYVIVLKNFHPYLFVTTALDAVRTDTPLSLRFDELSCTAFRCVALRYVALR